MAIGIAIQAWLDAGPKSGLPPYLQSQLDTWAKNVFEPIGVDLTVAFNNLSVVQLIQPNMVGKLNEALRKTATLKAYSEHKINTGATGDDLALHHAKTQACTEFAGQLLQIYQEAIGNTALPFSLGFIPVTFSDTTNVSGQQLNWGGNTVNGQYYGYVEKSSGGGSGFSTRDRRRKPDTRPTKPGGADTIGRKDPSTVGRTPQPGNGGNQPTEPSTGGGSTTQPGNGGTQTTDPSTGGGSTTEPGNGEEPYPGDGNGSGAITTTTEQPATDEGNKNNTVKTVLITLGVILGGRMLFK